MMSINNCRLIDLPQITDKRGSLSFLESGAHLPFTIQRVYYLYNLPSDTARGAHAHKTLQQLIIAATGSFDILLDDGKQQTRYTLSQPNQGLYIAPGIWRDLDKFSPNAFCLVLASQPYVEADYIRNYEDFLNHVTG